MEELRFAKSLGSQPRNFAINWLSERDVGDDSASLGIGKVEVVSAEVAPAGQNEPRQVKKGSENVLLLEVLVHFGIVVDELRECFDNA